MKTCQPEALCFGPREEMIEKGLKRVEFLKKKGFEKAELYGVNEMGGLHTLTVCKHGHEAYGLPTNPVKKDVITMGTAMRTVTAVGTAAVVAGLAVSLVAARGYRREEMTIEEIKSKYKKEFSSIDISELDKSNFYVFKIKVAENIDMEFLTNILRSLSNRVKDAGIKAIFIPVSFVGVQDIEIFEIKQ